MYAKITIYGYGLTINDVQYGYETTYTQTKYLNTVTAGQRYEDFTFSGGTFGQNPTDTWYKTGIMKAKVTLSKEENGAIVFESNEILVDMLLLTDNALSFYDYQISTTSSTYTARLQYWGSSISMGTYGIGDINSYRLYLYDTNDNMIQDSGELYDWNSIGYWGTDYTFTKLQDDTTYKIKAKATLVCGYQIETETKSFTVNYEEITIDETHLVLTNELINACVNVIVNLPSITHTKVLLQRTIKDKNDWLALNVINSASDTIIFNDYYAIPNQAYTYKAIVYNGETVVNTYYNHIIHEFNGIAICDINCHYSTQLDIGRFPVSKNERVAMVEVLDRKTPYYIVNGKANYEKGSCGGLFTTVDNCVYDCEGNHVINHSFEMLDFLNDGKAKFLKYDSGQAWIVAITGEPSVENDNTDTMVNVKFNWSECADIDNNEDYIKVGLVRGDL